MEEKDKKEEPEEKDITEEFTTLQSTVKEHGEKLDTHGNLLEEIKGIVTGLSGKKDDKQEDKKEPEKKEPETPPVDVKQLFTIEYYRKRGGRIVGRKVPIKKEEPKPVQ